MAQISLPRRVHDRSRFSLGFLSAASLGLIGLLAGSTLLGAASARQAPPSLEEAEADRELRIEPASLRLQVGETAQITAAVVGADGSPQEAELMFFSRSRRSVTVGRTDGVVTALKPGSFEVIIRERRQDAGENQEGRAKASPRLSGTVSVVVVPPPMATLEILEPVTGFYSGTSAALVVRGLDEDGNEREKFETRWTVSPAEVATIDAFGELMLHGVGSATVQAEAEGHVATREIEVVTNPVDRLEIRADLESVRTGDVVHLAVSAFDAAGAPLTGVPVELSFRARPTDTLGPGTYEVTVYMRSNDGSSTMILDETVVTAVLFLD
ncbi:MAG: hypothetical protein AAGG01_07155 [Planctomycetota bacterium]